MKVSIIIAVNNSARTIERAIKSIRKQSYKDIEIIFINNNSSDNSLNIINQNINKGDIVISEPDNGLYNAINKGIKTSSGDIIGILHSDDFYPHKSVISEYIELFKQKNVSIVYGDVNFVSNKEANKIVRKYKSGNLSIKRLAWGWMPAHPSMFMKREIYDFYGLYDENYKICGDYEFICRIVKDGNFNYYYLKKVTCLMQVGGISTQGIRSTFIINNEIYESLKANNIYSNYFMLYLKYLLKIFEYTIIRIN